MQATEKLPYKVTQAARRFHKHRADYYVFMAAILGSSGGAIKPLKMFEDDIQRYAGKPRSILCQHWYDTYSNNGSNLAGAFQGTLPDDEVAQLRVAQDAGGDALLVALADLARMAKLSDRVRIESIGTVAAGLVGLVLALLMLTAFPVFSIHALGEAYQFLPLDYWGPNGKSLYAYSEWVKSSVFVLLVLIGVSFVTVHWSIANYTSPFREWLDENIVLYRVIRDLKGALFLATMSTLTKKRTGVMFTLNQSLEIFRDSAKSPWLKWRIDQIIEGADMTGSIGVQAFNTGMISKEMFFFLEDMQQAKGFAEGFEVTGRYVEGNILEGILKKMAFYRWALLIGALLVTVAMFAWQFKVIYEMRGAMGSFLTSG